MWNDEWRPPQCSPVEYLGAIGLPERLASSPCTACSSTAPISIACATLGVTLVSCPRSNRYVGVGSPPLEAFYAMDVDVAFGTDSLASVEDLNMFAELAEARRIAPKVPARALLAKRDADWRARARFRRRVRQHRAGQARGAHRRARARRRERCGRIPGVAESSRCPTLDRMRHGVREPQCMTKLATYLSFVRFSHSVFALPFALTGALLAWREQPFSWAQVAWIVVCMVSARSAAMGFNRLVDATYDALNPRTAMREIPRGAAHGREAAVFVIVASAVFVFAASRLRHAVPRPGAGRAGDRVLVFAREAVHHLHADVPRPGAWPWPPWADGLRPAVAEALSRGCSASRSVCGSAASTFSMRVRTSTSIAGTGCARSRRRSASPAPYVCRALMHVATVVAMASLWWRRPVCRRSISLASRIVAVLLAYEQSLVSDDDLSQVKKAFDLNG